MKRVARWGLGSFAAVMVLVTVAHLPPVAGWLGWTHHGGSGTCPFGYGKPAAPAGGAATARRASPGPAVLGFSLGATTRLDVQRWALAHALWCSDGKGGSELACGNAPGSLLGGLDAKSLWFEFASDDTLAAVRAVRVAPTVDSLVTAFHRDADALGGLAGEPAKQTGHADAATLGKGLLSQASAEYRRGDFRAELRATNFGPRGYVLTESYAL